MPDDLSIPESCRLYTAEKSRELDSHTINEFGIDGFTLMELAASGAAKYIGDKEGIKRSGLYVCGKGNNAGDALAVARYMVNTLRHSLTVCFLFGNDDLSADCGHNLSLLKKLKEKGADIRFSNEFDVAVQEPFDYIVDGIFGTGLNSDLLDPLPGIIERINSQSVPVYAMDIPSGLNADTGLAHSAAIQADFTFTFGTNKLGFYLNSAKKFTGEVVYIPLPFPSYLHSDKTILLNRLLYDTLPEIKREAKHKYDGGVVHILAGSVGLTGAAIMAAKSAWKQGAGAVFLYTPGKLMPVYEIALPNIIKVALGDDTDSHYKEKHADTIIKKIKNKKGFLVAGPGIGTNPQTGKCLQSVLSVHHGPVLLDADALAFWKTFKTISEKQKKNWLLTPHIGEASAYLKGNFSSDHERLKWAQSFTSENNCSMFLKGNPAIFSHVSEGTYITEYDTSIFSRAGFGDVLSGTIAAFSGIENNLTTGTLKALYQSYLKSKQATLKQPFGPEDLL